jgi:hypothetical protein
MVIHPVLQVFHFSLTGKKEAQQTDISGIGFAISANEGRIERQLDFPLVFGNGECVVSQHEHLTCLI